MCSSPKRKDGGVDEEEGSELGLGDVLDVASEGSLSSEGSEVGRILERNERLREEVASMALAREMAVLYAHR